MGWGGGGLCSTYWGVAGTENVLLCIQSLSNVTKTYFMSNLLLLMTYEMNVYNPLKIPTLPPLTKLNHLTVQDKEV